MTPEKSTSPSAVGTSRAMSWTTVGQLCTLLFTLLLAAPLSAAPRNVLLIIADDQGRDLGGYGNKAIHTPNLDALAARGTLFTQAFSTVSSCSPSRSVIYTGLYSHTNGMYGLAHDIHNQHLLPTVKTLPVMLREAGYATALVGKKHILPDQALPFDQELAPEQPGNRDVAHIAEEAKRFIAAQTAKPFFVVIGFSDPHRAPENFGNTREWPRVSRTRYSPSDVEVPSSLPDLPEVRADLAQYYESISRLDSGVGLLVEALRATHHESDTLVIYLSDNGRAFPGAKTTLYDEGILLPLIIYAPGSEANVRNTAMVSWIDITPTILEWTGASAHAGTALPGRSLLPILSETNPPGWDRVFASHSFHEIQQYYPMRAVRTRQYKYILNIAAELPYPIAGDVASSPSWHVITSHPSTKLGRRPLETFLHRPREELYDVTSDPQELTNLANDPAHQPVLKQMRADLQRFRAATHDPWLPGESNPFGNSRH
jgi:N-sulfoglucosamine sulfohydrolase